MATVRPHFNKSVAELEALYASAPTDQALIEQIQGELSHRSTERAAVLLRRIDASRVPQSPHGREERLVQGKTTKTQPVVASGKSRPTSSLAANAIARARADDALDPLSVPRSGVGVDQPAAILASWVALEALAPQTYRRPSDLASGDQRCIAVLEGDDLPWFRNERSRPNYQLYYQVVLGAVHMDRATNELIKVFGDDEERSKRDREKAPIAAVLLDRQGHLVQENGVAVSSFAWALPIALGGNLAGLGGWTSAEKDLVEGLTARLACQGDDGESRPLDAATLFSAFDWLNSLLGLPPELTEEPTFAIRVFHYFKAKNPPEVALLNSFFLADISRASDLVRSGCAGTALSRYIGIEKKSKGPDLLTDRVALEELLAPSKMPAARWPAPGGYPLVTLQQAAVNAIRSEFRAGASGIASVNGPPGTGKTTLLRDVVAACIVDRALAMVDFDDPMSAFSTTGQKVAAGDRAFLHLYRLHDSLKGHEVLIASSNNKAVENVSRELPAAKAVGRDDLQYFRSVSDRLLSKRTEDGSLLAEEESWGLVAAVLGNAANRNAFQQAIWWDDDRSLRLYLKAAKGDAVFREVRNDNGELVSREIPTVVSEEQPPTPEQAKRNWRKARQQFKALHNEVETELARLEKIRQMCLKLPVARRGLGEAIAERDEAGSTLDECVKEVARASAVMAASQEAFDTAERLVEQAKFERPGFFARLFRTERFRRWVTVYESISAERAIAGVRRRDAVVDLQRAKSAADDATLLLRAKEAAVATCTQNATSLESALAVHRQEGVGLVDDAFFEQGHERWNLGTPWASASLHRKREDLFAAGLAVHRAFIDVTAQKVLHNLGVLMGAMQVGAFQDEAKKSLLGDLWSTLFMIVPAVSTTFASVDRMLGDLGPASLGWLLVDEAGQATPQSAVGAVMRVKRAIVVGDPLQIPPVVSQPERLVLEICKYFKVSPQVWTAPEASVQTVADQASRFQAEFRAEVGVRHVGLPLLVHRRCLEPMFGISNQIAYDGQMVHAAGTEKAGAIGKALGPSAWLDVDGSASTKWCEAEGAEVIQLLTTLARAGVQAPDIYIITPFRIVAYEMRILLESEPGLFESFGVGMHDWLKNRVGTIHTFQGKEAEAVVAVLGAPMAAHQGARRWASSTPNILNVMVSRAKQRVYVVGSRAAWGSVGHARTVAAALPVRTLR